jgi:hypothetical protein
MTAVSDRAEGSLPVPSGRDEVGRPGANDLPVQETSAAVIAAEAELLEGPPPGQAPRARPSASTFDEMAFLNSVVDTPAKATDRAEPPRVGAALSRPSEDAIENRDATADTSILGSGSKHGIPLGANISGNNPIVLRDKPAESARTLKCSDCGAMNYPTEWYCERCGAELASL